MKSLAAYFSASGVTAKVTKAVADAFLKGYDLSGIKIALFATSGGSSMGKTAEKLQPYLCGAVILDAKPLQSAADAAAWVRRISQ